MPRSKVLELCGEPGPRLTYIFNGDFVDRGEFTVHFVAQANEI